MEAAAEQQPRWIRTLALYQRSGPSRPQEANCRLRRNLFVDLVDI